MNNNHLILIINHLPNIKNPNINHITLLENLIKIF